MTLVYCSRDFSTLRSLYPRQYWSLTTEGGAARNSYKCKYICCCVILVLLCLLLSPVLAFLYHLFPFSFVRRSLSSSSVCLFVLVYFVVRAFDYTLCVLLRIRACTCAVSFMLNFVSCLLDSNFIFSFCGCPFFSSSSGMVTTTQGMFSLLPIGRHLCSFAHIRIRATLLRIAASAKLSHVILRLVNQPPRPALTRCRRLITLRFRCLPHAIPGVWSATIISCDYTPIIMRAQLRTYSLLNSLIHLLLSSLCSQSATCSFLFRVILLLAVVN